MTEEEKAAAVGHIPSGLFIICAKDGEQKDGYLASWVQQVSFKPLIVALAIGESRPGYKAITSGKNFTVNIVGDHNANFLKYFWKGYDDETNPFKEIEHEISNNDGILIKDAKSVVECKMLSKSAPGDHEIIFAEVIGSYVFNDEAKPKTHIRKSGLDY